MKGDAVVAALPQWRERIERMADKAPAGRSQQVKLLPPVARPTKLTCAPTNYQAHIDEMEKAAAAARLADRARAFLENSRSRNVPESQFRPGRPVGRHSAALSRPPQRPRGRTGDGDRQGRQRHSASQALDHVAGYCLGLDMTVRGREDRSFRKSVDGYAVLGPWMVTADEIPDPDAVPISLDRQRRKAAEQQYQQADLQLPPADRIRLANSTRSIRAISSIPARPRASAR